MRLPKVLHHQPRRIVIAAVWGLLVIVALIGLVISRSVEETTAAAHLVLILAVGGLILVGAILTYIVVQTVNELRGLHAREKEVAEEARNSEERFRLFTENAQDLIYRYRYTPTPGFEYVSPSATAITGYTPEEHYADPELGFKIVHPDDRPLLESVVRSPESPLVLRWRHKDGSIIWTEQRNKPIYDEAGNLVALEGIVRDITESKQAEEALRESEERYKALYEDNPSMYFTLDVEGTVLSVNRFGAEQLGYTVEELVGHPVLDVFHEEDKEGVSRHLSTCLQDPERIGCWEVRKVRKDGSTLWVRENVRVVRSPDDGTVILVACEDVTERKRAEEELRLQKTLLEAQSEASIDGILVVSDEGRMVSFNRCFVEMWEIPDEVIATRSDEAALQTIKDKLVNPQEFLARVAYLYEHPDEESHEEILLKDGRTFDRYSAPVKSADGTYYGRVWFFRDITERKKAEEALGESEERFRTAFESAPIGMALVGLDGRWLKVNRSLREILGYSEEELLATNLQSITHPDDLDSDLEYMRQLLTGEIRSYQIEKRCFHKLGHIVWILLNASLVRDARGEPMYGIAQIQDITQSKWDEIELERLSRQNESILKSAGEGIYGLDLRERMTFVNPAAAKMLGYEPEELAGRHQHEIVRHLRPDGTAYPPNDCAIYAALRDGEVRGSSDEVFWRKDGTSFPVECVSTPIRENGRVTGAVVTFGDITERKRAEEALRESEERYRRLVELSPDAVIVQSSGNIVYINDAGTKLLGASRPEEIVGKPILSFIHPDYREAVKERIWRIREGRRAGLLEEKLIRLDGGVVDAEVVAAPIVYLGEPAAQVVIRDVTKRKRAEAALRESEERFRLLAENMSDLVCLHEPDGRYFYVSPSSERLLGYEPEELLGMDPYALFHPDDAQRIRSGAHAKVLERESSVSVTYRIRKKSGEYTWFETLTEPILDGEGNVVRLQTSSRDVSERKKVEEALAEAAQAKIDFLADVSHELRTPLTVIRGNAEVGLQLERDCVHGEILEEIVAESSSMSRMVEDILFLVRSDSTAAPFDQEPVPVEQFLTDLAGRAEVLARKRGALLETFLSGEGFLRVDPTRIEQAILALVDNAAKYGPEGGIVLISSHVLPSPSKRRNGHQDKRPKELCIEVADDGPGISEEDLARVFERFYRVDKARSKETGGTGLGLSIVRHVAENHGGWVTVESTLGEGSTFTVYLPRG